MRLRSLRGRRGRESDQPAAADLVLPQTPVQSASIRHYTLAQFACMEVMDHGFEGECSIIGALAMPAGIFGRFVENTMRVEPSSHE